MGLWTSSWLLLSTSAASHAATGAAVEAPSSGALSKFSEVTGAARHLAFKSGSINGAVRADAAIGPVVDGILGVATGVTTGKMLGELTGLFGRLGKSLHLKLLPRVVPPTKLST